MSSAAPTAPCRRARVVQDRKSLLWSHPTLHVDLFGRNPSRRLRHCLAFTSTGAIITFPMCWNLNPDNCRPQVCYVTKKVHRTLFVPILQLSIRRTHPTQRLNATLD